jgi:hypothetical protein
LITEVDGVKQPFERNDSLEIETYDGKTDTASIRWVNDCEYILKKLHQKTWQKKSNRHGNFKHIRIRIPLNLDW